MTLQIWKMFGDSAVPAHDLKAAESQRGGSKPKSRRKCFGAFREHVNRTHNGSMMGRVFLKLHANHKNQLNVGKHIMTWILWVIKRFDMRGYKILPRYMLNVGMILYFQLCLNTCGTKSWIDGGKNALSSSQDLFAKNANSYII